MRGERLVRVQQLLRARSGGSWMSNSLAIATVTATLKRTLQTAVGSDPSGAVVRTLRPASENGAPAPAVNVFLYQVTPNAAWRNEDLPLRRADGSLVRRPQAALDLHYLLTFYGDDNQLVPQRLLGLVARHLHAQPVLTRAEVAAAAADASFELAGSDLDRSVELVKLTPSVLSLEELSKLWSVFFQSTYALSVTYQATVVLLESDEQTPSPALPVSARNLYVVPFRHPTIEDVAPLAGPGTPILATSTLAVTGLALRGEVTRVRVAGAELVPASATDARLEVDLTTAPPDALRAGLVGLQVVHRLELGTPPQPHRGLESNVVAIVLRPRLGTITPSDPQATVSVDVVPPVRAGQRATLLLTGAGGEAYAFAVEPPAADAATLVVRIGGVLAGDYLVRLQVDGAESVLDVDEVVGSPTFGQFVGPTVAIP